MTSRYPSTKTRCPDTPRFEEQSMTISLTLAITCLVVLVRRIVP
jgi:hypothetical protein